jgi:hypothetical protein
LKNGDKVVQGPEELLKLATDYYKGLFGPGVGNIFEIGPNLWLAKETATMMENDRLTRPFF